MKIYHVKDVVIPFSLPEKMEEVLNEIPGDVIAVIDTYRDGRGLPDNWRIVWVSEE